MANKDWKAEAQRALSGTLSDRATPKTAESRRQASVTFRDVRPGDSSMLLAWRNKPEIARFQYADHLITPEENAAWWPTALSDARRRYWIIQADGADVGLVNLCDIDERNSRCGWAFYIGEDSARGKGVGSATERLILYHVFVERQLHKLTCEVMDFNEVAVRLHLKFGFSLEGTLRQHVLKDGRWVDVLVFGLLRDQYLQSGDCPRS